MTTYNEIKKDVKTNIPPAKDRYKSICQKVKEGKQAACKKCNNTFFTVIKKPDRLLPSLCFLELYCPMCELTHAIYVVDQSLVGGPHS